MLIVTRLAAGSKLDWDHVLSLPKLRTARMASGHDVMVSNHVRRHFSRRMNLPGMHGEHRRHGHLRPGHHGHEQRHRDELVQHTGSAWQITNNHTVMVITSRCDSKNERANPADLPGPLATRENGTNTRWSGVFPVPRVGCSAAAPEPSRQRPTAPRTPVPETPQAV